MSWGLQGYFSRREGQQGSVGSSQEQVSEVVHAFRNARDEFRAPSDLDALANGLQIVLPLWDGGLPVS